MKQNEVYGVSTDGIETTPNEVYGVSTADIETTPNVVYGTTFDYSIRVLSGPPHSHSYEDINI